MTKVRITIPTNVQEMIDLGRIVKSKHVADGATSPLNALVDHPWAEMEAQLNESLELHLRAEELKRQMELTYRERDAKLKPVCETLKASRDLLLGIYRSNPKKLGEWGFKVSDSPSSKSQKGSKAKATADPTA